MSNILGIIAEYNPLHNGHVYQIQKAKELCNASYVVAVIGGNFQERGNTSIINKWEKTKMALQSGIDMVIELPTVYSTSSAENFAFGAIKILKELGFVTHISFGMECDDISTLNMISDLLYKEPRKYQMLLKNELSSGVSFPMARQNAIIKYFSNAGLGNLLSGSNNILAIEYLKAIKKLKFNVIPIGIKREKVFYNSKIIIDNYASSTAIRSLLFNNQIDEISRVMPASSFNILMENIRHGTYNLDLKNFSHIIIYKIRSSTISDLKLVPDVSEGLENSIKKAASETNDIYELINKIKSKRYTQTRLQRIMLYILLGITKNDIENSKKVVPYIRILGIKKDAKKLLSSITSKNVITSVKDYEKKHLNSGKNLRMLDIDKYATDVYTLGYKTNSQANLDYTQKLIIE